MPASAIRGNLSQARFGDRSAFTIALPLFLLQTFSFLPDFVLVPQTFLPSFSTVKEYKSASQTTTLLSASTKTPVVKQPSSPMPDIAFGQ